MNKTMGILSSVVLLSGSALNCGSQPEGLPLASPPAPFVREAGALVKTEAFLPKITGDRIISGNKILRICDDGVLYLFAGDDQNPVKIDFGFLTDHGYGGIASPAEKSAAGAYDQSSQTFSFIASYPLEKAGSASQKYFKLTHKVTLAPDGIINISAAWDIPENGGANFKGAYFNLCWGDNALGKKVTCGGKEYTVNNMEGEAQYWFMGTTNSEEIEFFPNLPKESFKMTPKKFGLLLASSIVISGDKLQVRLNPAKDRNAISFDLDIRAAVAEKSSDQTYAGIDFKAIDDLEMPDFKACRNLMPNPSFEQGLMFRCPVASFLRGAGKEKWTELYAIDHTNALFGKSCLKVSTAQPELEMNTTNDIPAAWRDNPKVIYGGKPGTGAETLGVCRIPLAPGVYTLSFYAKGDQPGRRVSIGGPYVTLTTQWKRFNSTFTIAKPTLFFCMIDSTDPSGVEHGYVYVDGLQLEQGDKVTEFTEKPVSGMLLTSKPDNFLDVNDKINAKLRVMAPANTSGKVRVTAKDFYSAKLFDQSFDFKCGKEGTTEVELPFEGKFPEGVFVVKAEYALEDGRMDYDLFRFSIMKFLENKHRLKDIFNCASVESSFFHDYPRRLERYRQVGFGAECILDQWQREVLELREKYGVSSMLAWAFHWQPALPVEGGHSYIVGSGSYGTDAGEALWDFRADNPQAKLTDEYLKKLEDVMAKNAAGAPQVRYWVPFTETRLGMKFGCTKDQWARIQRAFYRGVKKGNPKAGVMQGGPSNMSPLDGIKDVEEVIKNCADIKFDVIGIHPYRDRPEDPDLDHDMAYLLDMLDKNNYAGTKVIWDEGMSFHPYQITQLGIMSASWSGVGETLGALSYDMGWWEKVSAAWHARSWLVALKYQDRMILASNRGEYNFNLDADLTPFACQKIPNTLGNLLGNAYFKEDIRFAPYTRCYVFEDEQKRPIAAVWGFLAKLDYGTVPPFQASASFNGQIPEVFDLMGARRNAKADEKGVINFPISSFPLFFRGKAGDLKNFTASFKNAALLSAEGIMPVEMDETVASPDAMNVTIKNLVSKEYVGSLKANDASFALNVPPAGKSVISLKLPNVLKDNAVVEEKMKFQLTDSSTKKDFKSFAEFKSFVCHKATNDFVMDGSLDDWANIPEIKLENRYPDEKVDAKDFSAVFKAAWNTKGIYLAVQVKDDKFRHDEQVPLLLSNPWHNRFNNDALQVYFDTLCDARKHEALGYDLNDYDYGIFPNGKGDSSIVYRYRTPDIQLTLGMDAPKDATVAEDIPSAFRRTADGYVYEVFFPAKYLLPIQLEKGYAIGFGIFLNDRDADRATQQNAKSLTLTPPGTGCYNNPHLWPVMLLWE